MTGQCFLFPPFAVTALQCKPQALLLPTFSPALSCQHHFDNDGSPIFTCISHFPYVAGCLTSLPASQTHNFDVKVSLLKIELLIISSNSHLLAITVDNTTMCLNSLDFKFHGPFNSFLHHFACSNCHQILSVLFYDISNIHHVPSNPYTKIFVQDLSFTCTSYSKVLFKVFFPML